MLVFTTPKVLLLLTTLMEGDDDFGSTKPSEQLSRSMAAMATSVEERDGATMMLKCSAQNPIAKNMRGKILC